MRQGCLAGQVQGLRPAQGRRLERLLQRRHSEEALAGAPCLERLAEESRQLDLPLHLLVDRRGLTRLLWVGPLRRSRELLDRLPGSRRTGGPWRLLSCLCDWDPGDPRDGAATVALDLEPRLWLRYPNRPDRGGTWPARLFRPDLRAAPGWQPVASASLQHLCEGSWAEAAPPEPPALAAPSGEGSERVLLLVLRGEAVSRTRHQLDELEGLVRSAGGTAVGVVSQRRQAIAPQTIWGAGKLREAALEARRLRATLVVTDRDLTPVQCRNLERVLDLPVTDRSELILDIFAQRASSAAGRLQVELAQLRYRLPRLQGRGQALSRQGGGIGTRGPGETQLEKDRRAITRRIDRLQRQVARLGDHRARLRQGRRDCRRIALVGYTNAGKSSLLNALTRRAGERGVAARDRLFETLDPTTRRLPGGDRETILITDTVGFIRDLPPPLLEAFRSTLEEALEADLLLLVVNLADPAWPEQLEAVHRTLDALGSDLTRQVVANQIDRCDGQALERARCLDPPPLFVSATHGDGLARLTRRLRDACRNAAPTVRP